jgi:hypothetical protein
VPRLSFEGFRDPVKRPRLIIWTGVVLISLAVFVGVAFSVSSVRYFCAQVCHKVQDDTIRAYEASSHSEISCIACHEPVNADPLTFTIAKAKSALEIIPTVSNTFTFPLNPGSALALKGGKEMGSQQCTQCHTSNRTVTSSRGILIDHAIHEKKGIWCTVCHNRVAHDDAAAAPVLKDPKGTKNPVHVNYMTMDGCFRCHDLEGKKTAPGSCSACHTADFPLKPASHLEASFYPKGHAELFAEKEKEFKVAEKEAKVLEEEGIRKDLAAPVNNCYTCHVSTTFCDACHGMPIPHPAGFIKTHGPLGKSKPAACAKCHAKGAANATGLQFCNACHHKQGDPTKPWIPQHVKVVGEVGANACFECHSPTFCANCHVRGPK